MSQATLRTKAETLRRLHEKPNILVLPNVWDLASARLVEFAGFPALATTSSGIAFSLGYPDGEKISRGTMLDLCGRIARRARVPVSADIEAGYGPEPKDTAQTVRLAIAAGIVGGNIEDGTPIRRRRCAPSTWPWPAFARRARLAKKKACPSSSTPVRTTIFAAAS